MIIWDAFAIVKLKLRINLSVAMNVKKTVKPLLRNIKIFLEQRRFYGVLGRKVRQKTCSVSKLIN